MKKIVNIMCNMTITLKQGATMFWRRLGYFMTYERISKREMAKACGMTYRGFLKCRSARSCPRILTALRMSDALNISLEELVDPRIPITEVELPEQRPYRQNMERAFSDERLRWYLTLCMKDTELVLTGSRTTEDMQ